MSLVIVNTGVANISSVKFAFERLGITPIVTDTPEIIRSAARIILPGVGAAPLAMETINSKGLTPVLQSLTQPVMGICLGMQLLFETLEEGETTTKGLGLIPGTVERLDTQSLPTPHMGWNTLAITRKDPILSEINANDYAYFVHGFSVKIGSYTLSKTTYGSEFSAIVRHNNIYGCQFHPERSAKTGAKILENFLKVSI